MLETTPADISPLALSILELLNERPMHPYELAATMRARHHDEFIRLNFGSLYHTVDTLERNLWIVPAEREKEGNRPERTIYRLTDSGRQILLRVVGEILTQLGRYDESNAAYDKALPIREELTRSFPAVVEYSVNLAGTYGSVTLDRYSACPATRAACFRASSSAFTFAVSHWPHSSRGRRFCGRNIA